MKEKKQLQECLSLLEATFGRDLLGVYLYGSAIYGGLQRYSDIDLLVVLNRASTAEEKRALIKELLKISGRYMKSQKRPIEMTMVVQDEVNPWRFPPSCDFQYGEWLYDSFAKGESAPNSCKMPDLAILITQVLLASQTLVGAEPKKLLSPVPYKDFVAAMTDSLPDLMANLESDTRNVLFTLARIWSALETNEMRSKPAAAKWVMDHLPKECHPVMERALAISHGGEKEHWDDLGELIQLTAEYMLRKIDARVAQMDDFSEEIRLCPNI